MVDASVHAIEFRVLGPLEVLRDGVAVALGGERQRALLARLLVSVNELVRSDGLVDELFGERGSASAVRVAVSRLRSVLGDGEALVLQTGPGGYVLKVGPEQVDALRFERLLRDGGRLRASGDAAGASEVLREALGLWRAAPLADLALMEFAQAEIRRLEELRLYAVMERIDADLDLGDDAGSSLSWTRWSRPTRFRSACAGS